MIEAIVRGQIEETAAVLGESLEAAPGPPDVNLVGGGVLEVIAIQVVFPVVSGLISNVLYEKWKSRRIRRRDVDARLAELEREVAALHVQEPVAEDRLVEDAVAVLVAEGLNEYRARQVATATVTAMQRRLRT